MIASLQDYQPAPELLKGRIILVTGAGDGLGRAAALAFARYGASVILLGRTQKKLESVYDRIEQEGWAPAQLMPVDLSKTGIAEYEQIANAILNQHGKLDGILHSAAILGNLTPLDLYDLGTWPQVMQVNLNAPYLLTRACMTALKKSEDASVVFTTSDVARSGRPYWGAYAAAGAALENICRIWSFEHAESADLRFNTFDPGAVRTALRNRAYPAELATDLPEPASRVPAYLYLLGPASRGRTGERFSMNPPP